MIYCKTCQVIDIYDYTEISHANHNYRRLSAMDSLYIHNIISRFNLNEEQDIIIELSRLKASVLLELHKYLKE